MIDTENLIEVPLACTEPGNPAFIAKGTFLLRKIHVGQKGKNTKITIYDGNPQKGGKMVSGARPYSNDSHFTLNMWIEGEMFYTLEVGENGQLGDYTLTYENSILAKERARHA